MTPPAMPFRFVRLSAAALSFGAFAVITVPTAPGGEVAANSPPQDCVEADIGNDHAASLGCLNQRFAHSVELAHQAQQGAAPIDAQSPSNVVGTANTAAAQEMMGNAFGKSAIPQRPQLFSIIPLLQTARQ